MAARRFGTAATLLKACSRAEVGTELSGQAATGGRRRGLEECQRQEREAVRRPEEEGHVQAAGREDRQLPRRVQPRWQAVRFRRELPQQLQARRDVPAEEGSGAQRREG